MAMKARIAAVSLVVMAAGGLALAAARRQDQAWAPPKPTKFHEFRKQMEGTWDTTAEFMGDKPGDPMQKSKGSGSDKLALNGLFLITDYKGEMGGAEFIGHGIMGYDTHKKKYTGSWVDSMSTAIWSMEGTVDDAGKIFSGTMEGPNPVTGETMKMRMVTEVTGKDSKRMTMFATGEEGKEMQ